MHQIEPEMKKLLTKKMIRAVQQSWGDGIIKIGNAFRNKEDYKSIAAEFIKQHYGYDDGIVLFKPTLASIEQFRDTFEKAFILFYIRKSKPSRRPGICYQAMGKSQI
jgi:hypothetical protein